MSNGKERAEGECYEGEKQDQHLVIGDRQFLGALTRDDFMHEYEEL